MLRECHFSLLMTESTFFKKYNVITGNNELEWYTPSNTIVSNGKLIIEARKFVTPGSHPASYTSSKIISRGKADFGVVRTSESSDTDNTKHSTNNDDQDDGTETSSILQKSRRFEARLKLPWGRGIWPAFWMLPTYDTYGGWPKSGEIDIMENIGKEGPNTVHGTVSSVKIPAHVHSVIAYALMRHVTPLKSRMMCRITVSLCSALLL